MFTVAALVLVCFGLNPLFVAGVEATERVAFLVAGGIILTGTWVAAEIAFAVWEALASLGRWLFPPYGTVR